MTSVAQPHAKNGGMIIVFVRDEIEDGPGCISWKELRGLAVKTQYGGILAGGVAEGEAWRGSSRSSAIAGKNR